MKKLKEKGMKKENYAEQYLRNVAEAHAIDENFNIYDIYKKAHRMVAFPYAHQQTAEIEPPQSAADRLFGFK